MTQVFRPTNSATSLAATDAVDGFDFATGDYPNAVLVTNTDTANAVVVSVAQDQAGTYALYPVSANNDVGYGVVVQPRTSVVIAVNTQFAANAALQMASTVQCDTGLTAQVIFNAGSLI